MKANNFQIDRLLTVSGREDLAQFSHQFSSRTRKDLSDGHLWFSVFGRPAASRFTRLQVLKDMFNTSIDQWRTQHISIGGGARGQVFIS